MATLITNIAELTTNVATGDDPTGTLTDAAVLIEGERIAWVGAAAEAPTADEVVDAGGRAVIPGFVDSHSHLVFGGDRAAEFEARMAGQKYAA
uniref:amidohydrolase family protein n=1 Tax=Microbacterium maritypicum TaxID=33918 RepID=UPI00296EF9E8